MPNESQTHDMHRRDFFCLLAAPVILNIDRLMPLSTRANGIRHMRDLPMEAIHYDFYRREAIISYHGELATSVVILNDAASITELTRRVAANIRGYYDNPGLNGSTCYDARHQYAQRQIRRGLQLPAVKRYVLKTGNAGPLAEVYHFSTVNLDSGSSKFGNIDLDHEWCYR